MSTAMPIPQMTYIERDSVEWLAAWRALGAASLAAYGTDDVEAIDVESGESWQYLGSSYVGDGAWMHHFRHRRHPKSGRREYIDLPATAGFQPEVS